MIPNLVQLAGAVAFTAGVDVCFGGGPALIVGGVVGVLVGYILERGK